MQALEAHRLRLLAALGHLAAERAGGPSSERLALQLRAIAAEVGAQARVSDRTVEREIGQAMSLVDAWPVVLEAFARGRIGRVHVRAITEAGGVLASTDVPAERRAAFETTMVALAETTTPARVSRVARIAADAHVHEPLVERHARARDARHVRVAACDDGMALLTAFLPAVLARGIDDRLRQGARAKAASDPRTVEQWRADALCDAETARALAGAASTWERLLTDPVAGTVVAVDAYVPTAAQRRLLRARDQRCRFPGCGARARDGDVDHTIAWEEGGTTSLGNLAHLCRRHHTLKHATAWSVRQPASGVLRWRSPLG